MELFGPMTRERLLRADYIAQIFDYPAGVQRSSKLVELRTHAKDLKCTREFDILYNEVFKAINRDGAGANDLPLIKDDKGRVMATIDNFATILRQDPEYADIRYNMLTTVPERNGEKWTDTDDSWMRGDIEARYGIHSKDKLQDAFNVVMRERQYHPVRDIIDNVTWDGVSRIHTLLTKWLKCEDTPYTREVSRLIFAGGTHRTYNPGCKFDDMAVLIGSQGSGKSTFARWLALRDKFFAELQSFEGKESMETLDGKFILEVSEMAAFARARDAETIKGFVSRTSDYYRKAYGHRADDYPRQCIIIGTGNHPQFIADKTGGRRFYPIITHSDGYDLFDHEEEVRHDIEQCWAEAKYLYDNKLLEPFASRSLVAQIRAVQAEASEDDYRVGMVEAFLTHKTETCIKELWCQALGNEERNPNPTRRDSNDLTAIMEALPGWRRSSVSRRFGSYGVQRVWEKTEG